MSEPGKPLHDPSTTNSGGGHAAPGMPLHTRILIGLTAGVVLGLGMNLATSLTSTSSPALSAQLSGWTSTAVLIAEPVGKVFLRLLIMVVVPLVFSALALAVVEIGDVRKLGRTGLWALAYTGILSSCAVLIGVGLVNLFQPGKTLKPEQIDKLLKRPPATAREVAPGKNEAGEPINKELPTGKGTETPPADKVTADVEKIKTNAKNAKSFVDVLINIIPENPLQEMVGAVDGSSKGNGLLAVMFFALVCGIACTRAPEETAGFVRWLEGLESIAMTVIHAAMTIAPYGAGCLVFSITARLGLDAVWTLGAFVATTLAGLGLQMFVVYSIVIWCFSGMTPRAFFRGAADAIRVAFGTSSSSATLPTAMQVAIDDLHLPPQVSNFVLTVGATGNQNGTALFEGVVVLFLAQVSGIELSMAQQFTVVLMSILAGVGTAGVPGGSLPLIVVVLQSVGIPAESIGIILGVDRLLDMCRTVVNVTGDLVIASCVARSSAETAPPA